MSDDLWDDQDGMDDDFNEWDIDLDEYLMYDLDVVDSAFNEDGFEKQQDESDKLLDNVDTLILGFMIFGIAYEDALADKRRKKKH